MNSSRPKESSHIKLNLTPVNMNFLKFRTLSLLKAPPLASFANINTSNFKLIHRPLAIKRTYTREYLENYSKNPNFEADKVKEEQVLRKKEHDEALFANVAHDKNPKNYIKVLQKPLALLPESKFQPLKFETPLYSIVEPRKPKILIQGVRRQVPCKLKKLIVPMQMIIGMHLYDALAHMEGKNRKSFRYVAKTLQQVRNHAINRGFDESRLYVVEALTGKHRRSIGLRYHGKARSGRVKHDCCQLRIKLAERSYEDMFKEMIRGKTPPMLAYSMREKLVEEKAGYEEIRKRSWIITAKGRQQQKLMLKRRVQVTFAENLVKIRGVF